MNTDSNSHSGQTLAVLSAVSAFAIWGLSPIYFKQVAHVPATEVLANRIIWSFVLLTIIAFITGQAETTRQILCDRQQRLRLLLSSVIVSFNWLLFIWAISHGHILDTSLGYYLNPVFNVFLAMIFLKERLSRLQVVALVLAAAAVAWQILALGRLPLVSLLIVASFGFYGLIRKKIAVAAVPGLLLETMMVLPLALGWVLWLALQGKASFGPGDLTTSGWLMLAGVMTSAPLLLYTAAAVTLRFTTISFIQYLAPTLSLTVGVLIYGEPFGRDMQISFALIWAALLCFSVDAMLTRKNQNQKQPLHNSETTEKCQALGSIHKALQ